MALQRLRLAHQADVDLLPGMHATQAGLLEVAVHPERTGVQHRHHRAPGSDIVAGAHGAVVDVAIAGAAHLGAGQVEPGQVHGRLRGGHRGLRGLQLGPAHFGILGGDQVGQAAVTGDLPAQLLQRGAAFAKRGLGLFQGDLVTRPVDDEQHLATLHRLVVGHLHRLHQPGHVRGHLHHVGADVRVARPRLVHVVGPQVAQHQHGGEHRHDGQHDRESTLEDLVHDCIQRIRENNPPSTITYTARLNRAGCQMWR
ncbi:hypothetical protein D3C71_1185580 [compost metagenome]